MILEFADPVGFIIGECLDRRMKRKDIAKTYALLLKHAARADFDWKKINAAIMERWSPYALKWIKEAAWSGRCWK